MARPPPRSHQLRPAHDRHPPHDPGRPADPDLQLHLSRCCSSCSRWRCSWAGTWSSSWATRSRGPTRARSSSSSATRPALRRHRPRPRLPPQRGLTDTRRPGTPTIARTPGKRAPARVPFLGGESPRDGFARSGGIPLGFSRAISYNPRDTLKTHISNDRSNHSGRSVGPLIVSRSEHAPRVFRSWKTLTNPETRPHTSIAAAPSGGSRIVAARDVWMRPAVDGVAGVISIDRRSPVTGPFPNDSVPLVTWRSKSRTAWPCD